MNNNTKAIGVAVVLLVALLSLTTLVSADSDLYEVTDVEVNGIDASSSGLTNVELDDELEVEVQIVGTGNDSTCPSGNENNCETDVRVKAWIGGYEYGDMEDSSNTFTVEPGVSYKKVLNLNMPADLDVEDDNEFTLYVEIFDDDDTERASYTIFAERPRHSLNVVDVLYDRTVEVGDYVPVEVRLENLGAKKEEDIKVEVEIDGLVSDATYLSELAEYEVDNEDEESSDSVTLTLALPRDVEEGTYDLEIRVTYSRGHEVLNEVRSINVRSADNLVTGKVVADTTGEARVSVSMATKHLDVKPGETSTTSLTLSNTGSASESYVVSLLGAAQWASTQATPSVLVVGPGQTESVDLVVTPNEDATGRYDLTAQVLDSNRNLVLEFELTADVDGDSKGTGVNWLKVIMIVLVLLLILIALVGAFKGLKSDDGEDDLLEPKDGTGYY